MNKSVTSFLPVLCLILLSSISPLSTQQEGALAKPSGSEGLVDLATKVVKKLTGDSEEKKEEAPAEEPKEAPIISPEEETRIYTFDRLKELVVDHKKTIPFCMVGSFQGHFRLYGTTIRNGMLAHFRAFNQNGGLNGKWVRLICVDDFGKPDITHKIITNLRKKHGVDIFVGNMGTRNTAHILSLVQRKKIALLFPWGGGEHLYNPNLGNLVNGLGNIKPQLSALIDYCTQALLMKKIAIFYSDGTFYSAAKNIAIDLLKEKGLRPAAQASYNRFTMDINTPAQRIIAADPKIVICLGSSYPVAKLISRFFELGHYGTTFVGIDSTMFVPDILRAKGAVYSYASTIPNPTTSTTKIAQQYRNDMQAAFPNDVINILSFSYYIHAHIITRALKKVTGKTPLKQSLIPEIEKMNDLDLDGFAISFDKQSRHAYPHTISIIKGGK